MKGKMTGKRNWLRKAAAVAFSVTLLGGGLPVQAPAVAQEK